MQGSASVGATGFSNALYSEDIRLVTIFARSSVGVILGFPGLRKI
jgi:hypothetical protein